MDADMEFTESDSPSLNFIRFAAAGIVAITAIVMWGISCAHV